MRQGRQVTVLAVAIVVLFTAGVAAATEVRTVPELAPIASAEPVPAAPTDPARIVVPKLGVDASVIRLGLDEDGALQVPATAQEAGWWSGGPQPGERGPAVIAGHVDLDGVPGVFHGLHTLVPGDSVELFDENGGPTRFTVTRVERHRKRSFPTADVYGPTLGPELRLITCGGPADRRTGHYRDNVIVFALPAGKAELSSVHPRRSS
jgi:sortase (surface protein transpeptidase)